MNDLSASNWHNAVHLDREDRPAVKREIEYPPKTRPRARRRWGGRLVSLGALLALASGLSFGAWGNYSQHEEVIATARQESDFVPTLRVATIAPSPGTRSVTLPGTTAAFASSSPI